MLALRNAPAYPSDLAELLGATGVRMVLAGPEGSAAVVRDLADRESACCSFFEFTVSDPGRESGRERVVVEVHLPPAHADVVAALAAGLPPRVGDVTAGR
jgi:hypothetical protein